MGRKRCRCYDESVVLIMEGKDNIFHDFHVGPCSACSATVIHDFVSRVQLRSATLHAAVLFQPGQDLRLSCITSLGKDEDR